jgi:hypothetical protein
MSKFSEIVDAMDKLSIDEQEAIVHILRRRIAEQNRSDLVRDVAEARAEFTSGNSQAASVSDIMNEVRGEV